MTAKEIADEFSNVSHEIAYKHQFVNDQYSQLTLLHDSHNVTIMLLIVQFFSKMEFHTWRRMKLHDQLTVNQRTNLANLAQEASPFKLTQSSRWRQVILFNYT